jgi:hypothetical protein
VAAVAAEPAVDDDVILRRRRDASGPPTLLVDHWYSHAVGHVIEALRRCQAYHAADPSLRISLVLNGASPTELASCVPFVERAYAVPYSSFGASGDDPRRALRGVPRDWDQVVHHPASVDPEQARFEGLQRYYRAARRHFRGRLGEGIVGVAPPAYEPHQALRLALPDGDRERAAGELGGRPTIAVMPAGSGARRLYPSLTSWLVILDELERRIPDAGFAFVGRLGAGGGQTVSGIGRGEVDRLLESRRFAVDAFDRPILSQLATVEAARVFLSPHTGFGMAALAVGTPWLTLSGGDWHEYLFNGVPFHSVIPKGRSHEVFAQGRELALVDPDSDGEGPRAWALSAARLREDLDEIADAAVRLVDGGVTYEDALADYFPRLLDAYGGDRTRIRTFEDVHADYA